jgi:Ca2+-binding RTX toxin-like protein
MRWRGVSLAGTILVAALAAGPVQAGTAQVVGVTIQFRAAAGEQNHVIFDQSVGGVIDVEDTGAPISPGPGCSPVSANKVICVGDTLTPLDADLGDGDDYASNLGPIGNVIFVGGPGADELRSGVYANTILRGGTGPDTMVDTPGGGGCYYRAAADYSDHMSPVDVDLSDPSPDGGIEDGVGDTLTGITCVIGSPGNDFIAGTPTRENFYGGDGTDHLVGGGEPDAYGDELFGELGSDTLEGGTGADFLDGGVGADTIDGGSDLVPDTASYQDRTSNLVIDLSDGAPDGGPEDGVGDTLLQIDNVSAGFGDDTIVGSDRNEDFKGGYGDDTVSGGPGNDWVWGGEGDDLLDGGPGADRFYGNGGFDTADYSSRVNPVFVTPYGGGPDGEAGENDDVGGEIEVILTGSGNDVVSGDSVGEVLVGGAGDDQLDGRGGNDELHGGPGDDTVSGGFSDDALVGGPGADELQGGEGEDLVSFEERSEAVSVDLDGEPGDDGEAGEGDTVFADVEHAVGGSGSDVLVGNSSDNALIGTGGSDSLSGAAGNDFLEGGLGADTMLGGDGLDAVSYADRTTAVSVDLDGQPGDDGEPGEGDATQSDIEDVVGGAGGDLLVGNATANVIIGGAGDDRLRGLEGEDLFDGAAGNDTLESRDAFQDRAFCGVGQDSVVADSRDYVEEDCELIDRGLQPPPPPPPPPAPPPPPPVRCVVPKVVGMQLTRAKRKLRAAHCRVGTVRTVRAKQRRGIVVRQSPRPRTRLRNGGKVKLTISRGRRG